MKFSRQEHTTTTTHTTTPLHPPDMYYEKRDSSGGKNQGLQNFPDFKLQRLGKKSEKQQNKKHAHHHHHHPAPYHLPLTPSTPHVVVVKRLTSTLTISGNEEK